MIQKSHFLIVVYFFATSFLFSQENKNEILAKIGESQITAEEFRMRYELMPQIKRHVSNSEDERKAELLYTMISEKLWAGEAKKLGLDSSDIMKYTYKSLEKMYIRDALYNQEVKSKAKVKNEDYLVGALRGNLILNVTYIYSESKDEIWNIYKQLRKGAQFDSLLSLRDEFLLQEKPYQVTFGRMEEFVEDSLFKLNVGEYTSPLKSPEGWYIFKLISTESVAINNAQDAEFIQKNIKNTVDMRVTDRAYDAYWNDFFKELKIDADGDLFWRLAEELTLSIRENKTKNQIPDGEKIILGPEDFYAIEKRLGKDISNSIFIKFPSEPVTVKEFLYDFAFEGFFTTVSDTNEVAARLNSRVKRFIEMELLAREGYKQEMYSDPEVKTSLNIWRDNYLANLFRNRLLRSVKVSDNETLSYYQKKNKQNILPVQVNIVEVLTDSLEIIEKVLNELDAGANLKDLARKYTKREWTREKGGEFGFFNVTEYGDIGRIAADMDDRGNLRSIIN